MESKNCGRKSIVELRELIYHAGIGRFSAAVPGDMASSLSEVARLIETGLAALSSRNRKIFEARLCGNDGAPRTLEDVSVEFGMTRERVRQIVKLTMKKLRRGGGPKLGRALEAVARDCEQRMCPLTPELFALWITETTVQLQSGRPHDFSLSMIASSFMVTTAIRNVTWATRSRRSSRLHSLAILESWLPQCKIC
jgi:hypothetical protein